MLPSAGVFVPILVNRAAQWSPEGPFPEKRLYHFYQMHSKQGSYFWCDPVDPSDCAACSWDSALLPTRAPLSPLGVTWAMALISETSDSVCHCLLKKKKKKRKKETGCIETLFFFSVSGFGNQFSCVLTCLCFHSFSLTTPSMTRAPSPVQCP